MAANEPVDPVKTESGESEAAPAASASPDKPQRKRRLDVNPSLILSTEGRSKRRRTPTPPPGGGKAGADPKEVERAKTLGMVIYNKIMNLHDQTGESMADPFVKLPNKRQFPDYYETIKHPMSLEIIHEKLEASAYSSLFDVISDFGQMWNNAKRYNVKESTLFQWARKMHKITRTFYNNHTAGENSSESEDELPPPPPRPVATPAPARAATATSISAAPSPSTAGPSTPAGESVLPKTGGPGTGKKRGSYMKDGPTVYKLIKPAMRDIKAAKSNDGRERDIATIFLTLPDRKDFPDYYRTIKNPVSLDEIEHRMITRRYHSSEEFFVEVERMCDNAMLYNEDESEVWRDARQIRDIVAHHREQVKERLAQPYKPGGSKMPTKTVTPVRHGSQQSPHVPTAGIPGVGVPQPLPPGMHVPPEMRGAYAAHAQYTTLPPGYAQQQQQQMHSPAPAQAQAAASYLPQLPHGVVTEEVVATLDRYPVYEQQAWMSTLPPLALNIYRQMAAAKEARKRGVPPPAPAVEQRSAAAPAPEPKPGSVTPTIKAIDFAYSDTPAGSTATSPDEKTADKKLAPPLSAAIRLHNMRGVATHAVAIASATSEVELTAWVNAESTSDAKPEVSLRVNGTTAVDTPKLLYGKENSEQPAGMRWTVPISPARVEFKIEFVATKPGALAETSAIFINRQF